MPGRDGTGPQGQGPMTGRGLGLANHEQSYGRGMGRGFGQERNVATDQGRGLGLARGFGKASGGGLGLARGRGRGLGACRARGLR